MSFKLTRRELLRAGFSTAVVGKSCKVQFRRDALGIAGNADIVVASDDATFGLPEVDRGALGVATHLARFVPQHKVRAHERGGIAGELACRITRT